MLRKLRKDVTRGRQAYALADDLLSPQLGEYYFEMTEPLLLSGHSQEFHFDDEGIPLIPTYIDVEERALIHYPISIGQYGLAVWHTFHQTGAEADRHRFLRIVDWFYRNRIEDERLGAYWLTDVEKPAYRIDKPWKSAFAQARAINLLLRAHQLTGDRETHRVAERALVPFQYSVDQGGVVAYLDEGPFYEEYPAGVPVLVLNGMVFSLCGVHDFLRVHPEHAGARRIFNDGVSTLARLLPRYDLGFWSRYSLCEASFHPAVDPATIGYHHLHIVQLELMYRLTGKEIFRQYSERWRGFVNLPNALRMYRIKLRALRAMGRL
jgi:hypothetical protein